MSGMFARRLTAVCISICIAAAAVLRWLYPEQLVHTVLIALIVGCILVDVFLHNARSAAAQGE